MKKVLSVLALTAAALIGLCSCETIATVDKGDITAAIKISVTDITSTTCVVSGESAQDYVTTCYYMQPVLTSTANFADKDAVNRKAFILSNSTTVSMPVKDVKVTGLTPGTSYTVAMMGADATGTFRTAPYYVTFTTSK